MAMRFFFTVLILTSLYSCGAPKRENPFDPVLGNESEPSIELIALLDPEMASLAGDPARLGEIVYHVSWGEEEASLSGLMNLVGGWARAVIHGVPEGEERNFQADIFDLNNIRIFSASTSVNVSGALQQTVRLDFQRLSGSVEITSQLPPELNLLEVQIFTSGDTLHDSFDLSKERLIRIDSVPTGSDINIDVIGTDASGNVLLERRLTIHVHAEFIARIVLEVAIGSLAIEALLPVFNLLVPIDRFSDTAATFFRRSQVNNMPDPNEPIDFDALFIEKMLGPNGEQVQVYNFDVRTPVPAPVYLLVDRKGELIANQLPIFDAIPGELGHNDFWQIHHVQVIDQDYQANYFTAFEPLVQAELPIGPTEEVMLAVMVPDGSKASQRLNSMPATPLLNGWYRDQIVKYIHIENPANPLFVDLNVGTINTPQMFGFFENDKDFIEGFAKDRTAGLTHNVVTQLPESESYAPLWALQIFKLEAFDRVIDVPTALDQARNEENLLVLPNLLYINAPIIVVE